MLLSMLELAPNKCKLVHKDVDLDSLAMILNITFKWNALILNMSVAIVMKKSN